MNSSHGPQFDRYAGSYHDLHKASVRASGEEPEYFAAYKVAHMATALGAELTAGSVRILDFGCGVGGSIRHLRKYFPKADLFGVDVSGESLRLARHAHPDVTYSQITTDRIELPDACVDVVMAACVYHHIPLAERMRWTAEIRRVLRPGGCLFLFEHNPLNPLTQKVVRDCPFDEDAILLPSSESLSLIRGAGFHDVDLAYIVFFPRQLARLRPLEKALGWLPLGAQYVVQGRK
jgi:SAM-dependent methyltransferase